MKRLVIILLFLIFKSYGYASHNRGARIEARPVGPYAFKIIITTFTKTSSIHADRPSLDSVHTGDGNVIQFNRDSFIDLPGDLRINTYTNFHAYPGPGRYLIYFIDPNRNANVVNIPNSITFPLSVETEIVIDTNYRCPLNSPQFLANPFFECSFGKDVSMNITAYDPNRDSLSYTLVACHGANNNPIPGYVFPAGVGINAVSGEFHWNKDSMFNTGEYNFAVKIDKWHNGVNVGHCLEDFSLSLEVGDTISGFINTNYPVNPLGFYSSSISVGDTFNLQVIYTDPSFSGDLSLLSEVTTSTTFFTLFTGDTVVGLLSWVPESYHCRKQPYVFTVRAKPSMIDLTYLVYVNGVPVDTCFYWVGVDEKQFQKAELSVSPVPTSDLLDIVLKSDYVNSDNAVAFKIYDLNGKCLMKDRLERTNSSEWGRRVDLAGLSAGMYFVNFESDAGNVNRKFIICR